jgi:hypothetical protein
VKHDPFQIVIHVPWCWQKKKEIRCNGVFVVFFQSIAHEKKLNCSENTRSDLLVVVRFWGPTKVPKIRHSKTKIYASVPWQIYPSVMVVVVVVVVDLLRHVFSC